MRPAGIVEDSYRERYLRRLHNKGYPATAEQLKKFIKSFYDDLALLKENKEQLRRVIQKFTCRSIKNSVVPRSMKNNPELKKMYLDVVADYQKKWMRAVPSVRKGTPARRMTRSLPKNNTTKSEPADGDEISITGSNPVDSNVGVEDDQDDREEYAANNNMELESLKEQLMEKEQKIDGLTKEVAKQEQVILNMMKKKVDMASTLVAKEGEIQELKEQMERMRRTAQPKESEVTRLEDELSLMNYQLDMTQMEAANQGQAKQTLEEEKRYLESTVLSMEEKNSWLEDKVRSMEGAKQALEDEKHSLADEKHSLEGTVRSMEEKNRSLEETVHTKDQMLETFLKMQQTLHSFINKPAPQ